MLVGCSERVQAGTSPQARLDELETATGFRMNPHSVALSPVLRDLFRMPDVIRYDWVHSALQQGVMNNEVEALMAATEVPPEELEAFLANKDWVFPKATRVNARQLHRIFDRRRASASTPEKVKASCSELLGVYGLLRVFFVLKLGERPEYEAHLASYLAFCNFIDRMLAAKQSATPTRVAEIVPSLRVAAREHLDKHLAVYGDAYFRPKGHWLQDVPAQFAVDGFVLDAFVVERLHLRVKQVAEPIKKTTSFERSVLQALLSLTFRDKDLVPQFGLLGRTAVLRGTQARVADRGLVNGVEVRVGEVVVKEELLGAVAALVEEDDAFSLLINPLEVVRAVCDSASLCRTSLETVVWQAVGVQPAVAWMPQRDGLLVICR